MTETIKSFDLTYESYQLYKVYFFGDTVKTLVTDTPCIIDTWISDTELLHERRLHKLVVGLDIEWRPNKSYENNPPATLQLCVGRNCLIIQLKYLDAPFPESLISFLSNDKYTFVGVRIDGDAKKLNEFFGFQVSRTVDLTELAADALDQLQLKSTGLKGLAREVLGKEMEKPKSVTLSDWDDDWLSLEQIKYACVDAFVSFEIGLRLKAWRTKAPTSSEKPRITLRKIPPTSSDEPRLTPPKIPPTSSEEPSIDGDVEKLNDILKSLLCVQTSREELFGPPKISPISSEEPRITPPKISPTSSEEPRITPPKISPTLSEEPRITPPKNPPTWSEEPRITSPKIPPTSSEKPRITPPKIPPTLSEEPRITPPKIPPTLSQKPRIDGVEKLNDILKCLVLCFKRCAYFLCNILAFIFFVSIVISLLSVVLV